MLGYRYVILKLIHYRWYLDIFLSGFLVCGELPGECTRDGERGVAADRALPFSRRLSDLLLLLLLLLPDYERNV